ncbi:MAG: hypothetical protein KA792_08090 [Bacteroidales bacterium]|nr:hypothetical protein [Bacteroidales bacterium]
MENNNFNSEMKLGFGFMQIQEDETFQNFLKKMEFNEENDQLKLVFSKFADKPVVIDFKKATMRFSNNSEKPFKKFFTVTYEYVQETKTIVIKTLKYIKGNFQKGIIEFNINDTEHLKLKNFIEIDSNNYMKTSKNIIEHNNSFSYMIPDFYKCCLQS